MFLALRPTNTFLHFVYEKKEVLTVLYIIGINRKSELIVC